MKNKFYHYKKQKFTFILVIALCALIMSQNSFSQVFPSGGENYFKIYRGQNTKIAWNPIFEGNVNIYLWNGKTSTNTLIASNVSGTNGNYQWSVPSNQALGDMYRIKIVDVSDPKFFEMSKSFFKIEEYVAPPVIASTEEFVPAQGISINPVPANDVIHITISNSDIIRLTIIDFSGRSVFYNINPENELNIDVNNWLNGIYYVKAELMNGNVLNTKFVVAH